MTTAKLFRVVFFAVLLANFVTVLALFGGRFLMTQAGVGALTGTTGGQGQLSASEERAANEWVPAIQDRIRQFWIYPEGSWEGRFTAVNVQLEPDGMVVPNGVKVITSSGNATLDQSVVSAIYDAAPLPVPKGRDFEPFRDFDMVLRP